VFHKITGKRGKDSTWWLKEMTKKKLKEIGIIRIKTERN